MSLPAQATRLSRMTNDQLPMTKEWPITNTHDQRINASGGTDILVCALIRTGRNACATTLGIRASSLVILWSLVVDHWSFFRMEALT